VPRLATLVLALAACMLTACTQYWAKPGGTEAEFNATKSVCETQSYLLFPPFLEQFIVDGGYVTPLVTTCSGWGPNRSCVTSGGLLLPPTYATIDQNAAPRDAAVKTCLYAAGWRQVKDKAEAESVDAAPPGSPAADMTGRQYCDMIFSLPQYEVTRPIFDNNYQTCVAQRTAQMGH